MDLIVTKIDTYKTINPLDVARALGVAVAGSVLGTSLVGRELAQTTVSGHGDKVDSSVETTAIFPSLVDLC